uniref:Peptidase_M14 domain-containing protein n=1 Tax=Anopheles funestus TaxID=62324 RepID=A0A4Y0BHU2_ANOFN
MTSKIVRIQLLALGAFLLTLATVNCTPHFALDGNYTNSNVHSGFRKQDVDDFNPFDFFLTYDETNQWMDALFAKYPEQCTINTIGQSYEGRVINAIIINPTQVKTVILVANLQGREWASMTSAIYIIHELIRNSKSYPQAANFRWIIVPISNPDGYEYTRAEDRNWNKNRVPKLDDNVGVDLNRNFGYMWELLTNDEDANPNRETYRGMKPFSEPESRAIKDLLVMNEDAYLYVDMHVGGQLILIPWGYTDKPAPNANFLRSVAQAGSSAILSRTSQYYIVGTLGELFNHQPGTSMDYCYSIGIKVCVEIRLTSEELVNDPKNIIPHGQEALAAVLAMAVKVNGP